MAMIKTLLNEVIILAHDKAQYLLQDWGQLDTSGMSRREQALGLAQMVIERIDKTPELENFINNCYDEIEKTLTKEFLKSYF